MKLVEIKLDLPKVKARKITKGLGKVGGAHDTDRKHKKRAKQKREWRRDIRDGNY